MDTVLNREVDNLWEVWKDAVLYVLHQWHTDPFNGSDIPMNVERIVADLAREGYENMAEQKVRDICKKLTEEHLVELLDASNPYFKISPQGIEYVGKLLTKF